MGQMSVFGAQPGFDHKYHTVALVVPATSTGVPWSWLEASFSGSHFLLTFSPLYRPVPPALGSPFLRLKPPS